MPHLFEPLAFRDLTLANRIVVSPMCQYSSVDGFANDWHFVHLASRAVGGAGLVFTEATAVTADGRISPDDLGIWDDVHIGALSRIVRFVKGEGSAAGMQLAHAGPQGEHVRAVDAARRGARVRRRVGADRADRRRRSRSNYPMPRAMTLVDIAGAVDAFRQAAERARAGRLRCGRDPRGARLPDSRISVAAEQHAHRRVRRIVREPHPAVSGDRRSGPRRVARATCRSSCALSATDWTTGGWDVEQSVELARRLVRAWRRSDRLLIGRQRARTRPFRSSPGYQVPFAERIRREAAIATGAVGLITTPAQANEIIAERASRLRAAGARDAARSVLAAACGARTRTRRPVAGAVPARGASRDRRTVDLFALQL